MTKRFKIENIPPDENNLIETNYIITDNTNELSNIKLRNKDNAEEWMEYLNNQISRTEYYNNNYVKYHKQVNELLTENYHLTEYNKQLLNSIKEQSTNEYTILQDFIREKQELGLNIEIKMNGQSGSFTIEPVDDVLFDMPFIKINNELIINIKNITYIN